MDTNVSGGSREWVPSAGAPPSISPAYDPRLQVLKAQRAGEGKRLLRVGSRASSSGARRCGDFRPSDHVEGEEVAREGQRSRLRCASIRVFLIADEKPA